jgi:hypothetical protein
MRIGAAASAIVGTTTVTAVLGPFTPAAHAGGCSAFVYCSGTRNDSNLIATAVQNWICKNNSTGDSSTVCVDKSITMTLSARGGATPALSDWDAFRVDVGWCYHVDFINKITGLYFSRAYYAGNNSPLFVKVSNDYEGDIRSQSPGSC